MNPETMGNLRELMEEFEHGTVARLFRFLLDFAEIGQKHVTANPRNCELVKHELDPAMTPLQAAEYLGISWQALRNTWVERYSIKSTGTGKNRRFRVSELNRVLEERRSLSK